MSSGTSTTSLVIIGVVAFSLGFLVRGEWDGSTLSSGDAAISSQKTLDKGIKQVLSVENSRNAAEAEVKTTQEVIREFTEIRIPVPADCPRDGSVPMSESGELWLREANAARKESAKREGRLQ